MGKKKCRVCANESGGLCIIKKIGVATNKPRICEAYIYDEKKLKTRQEIPTIKMGYKDHQESKRRLKEELKALKKSMEATPSQGTAKDLGLIKSEEAVINYSVPYTTSNTKHPLTGDLSRFLTTAKG